jgi:hypothetical protein
MSEGYITTEVATFRSDGAYSDGRHPDAVRYTQSAEEDVKRRDFTINGLLLDPLRQGPNDLRAAVIDFVGGVADLDAGIVRAIGRPEERFRRRSPAHAARRALCGAFRLCLDPEPDARHPCGLARAQNLRGKPRTRSATS